MCGFRLLCVFLCDLLAVLVVGTAGCSYLVVTGFVWMLLLMVCGLRCLGGRIAAFACMGGFALVFGCFGV